MLTISTVKMQELVSKAIKGVGGNKLIPRTMDIAIRVKDNVLTLITSDDNNYLNVSEEVESEDFFAVVQADQFSKLVMKTTSDSIALILAEHTLEFMGNGTCLFPLEIDPNTLEVVQYPNPIESLENIQQTSIGKIDVATIKTILSAIKPSLAVGNDTQFSNYYFGDCVLATDTFKIGCLKKSVTATPILVSAKMVELLDVYTSEQPMSIFKVGDTLAFVGENCSVCGSIMSAVDSYPVDKMLEYIDSEYPSKCTLPKQSVLQLLDRLSLFVDVFDNGVAFMDFSEDGLRMSSPKSDSEEVVGYTNSNITEPVSSKIYLEMFRAQVKAQTGDNIELCFGDDKSIKMVDENTDTTTIVSLVK